MTLLHRCPSCGLASDEVRCPRCNALKVIGCGGGCSTCESACGAAAAVAAPGAACPSDRAVDDAEHPGTPLRH